MMNMDKRKFREVIQLQEEIISLRTNIVILNGFRIFILCIFIYCFVIISLMVLSFALTWLGLPAILGVCFMVLLLNVILFGVLKIVWGRLRRGGAA